MQRRIRGGISREWASPRYDEIDAVVGIEIENECKRVITNVNEKNNIVVMSMFEDEDGHVQLKRKQVYNSGLQIVEKKEPTISESIKGMIFFVSFVYLTCQFSCTGQKRFGGSKVTLSSRESLF